MRFWIRSGRTSQDAEFNRESQLANLRLTIVALLFLSQNKPFLTGYEPAEVRYVSKLVVAY